MGLGSGCKRLIRDEDLDLDLDLERFSDFKDLICLEVVYVEICDGLLYIKCSWC
jgi:hypothetical protein